MTNNSFAAMALLPSSKGHQYYNTDGSGRTELTWYSINRNIIDVPFPKVEKNEYVMKHSRQIEQTRSISHLPK
jgi:hypothetical protein